MAVCNCIDFTGSWKYFDRDCFFRPLTAGDLPLCVCIVFIGTLRISYTRVKVIASFPKLYKPNNIMVNNTIAFRFNDLNLVKCISLFSSTDNFSRTLPLRFVLFRTIPLAVSIFLYTALDMFLHVRENVNI